MYAYKRNAGYLRVHGPMCVNSFRAFSSKISICTKSIAELATLKSGTSQSMRLLAASDSARLDSSTTLPNINPPAYCKSRQTGTESISFERGSETGASGSGTY